jgi:beta-glucosidase
LLGNYFGINDRLTTLLEGIASSLPEGVRLEYRSGTQLVHPISNLHDWSIVTSGSMDVTIACMGLTSMLEGEEGDAILSPEDGDRPDINLPAVQVDYIKRMAAQGARIVLVLTGGSPIALGELEDMVEAIVFVWYPGQEGGKAVADVLFGRQIPSGKLPMTFPRSTADLPPFENYAMAGRTYRYATKEPLFPFGFGLSYATFKYRDLKLGKSVVAAGESLPISLTVTNESQVDAEEVVQFYLSDLEASVPVPLHSLVGFQRVKLQPGESQQVNFTLSPELFCLVDLDGHLRLEPGAFRLTAGDCSPSQRALALGAPRPLIVEFRVEG